MLSRMYQGRSPLKDVVRSVVMGATMILPALLESCSRTQPPPTPPPDPVVAQPDAGSAQIAVSPDASAPPTNVVSPDASAPPTDVVRPDASAPPTNVVRPRTPRHLLNSMPTRGFSGGGRVRG
jgi:hypothetical protein